MKLKYKIQINEVAGQYVAVAIGEDAKKFKSIVFLNKVGRFIMELLKEETTENEIVSSVLNNYEGDSIIIREETLSFIKRLKELDVIENGQGT